MAELSVVSATSHESGRRTTNAPSAIGSSWPPVEGGGALFCNAAMTASGFPCAPGAGDFFFVGVIAVSGDRAGVVLGYGVRATAVGVGVAGAVGLGVGERGTVALGETGVGGEAVTLGGVGVCGGGGGVGDEMLRGVAVNTGGAVGDFSSGPAKEIPRSTSNSTTGSEL